MLLARVGGIVLPFVPSSRLAVPFFWCAAWLTTTLCAPVRADFSFAHVTDIHVGATDTSGSNAAKDIALFGEISAQNPRPAFVMATGDICETGTDAEYAVAGRVAKTLTVPYYAAPGNHDVRWNPRGKEGYTRGTGQPLYRSWNYENVHFVLLDSTVLLQHWGHFDKAELDWLAEDLRKTGDRRPVVIGFHHWVYRPGTVQVDNQAEFLRVISPYNIRLLLIGHGHSDLKWNVNGIPAVMAKGLYQGSYHVVRVGRDKLTVYRRTEENHALTEILTEPLKKPAVPARDVRVSVAAGNGVIHVARGTFPAGTTATFRVDEGNDQPLAVQATPAATTLDTKDGAQKQATPTNTTPADTGDWEGTFMLDRPVPGEHRVIVTLTTPEGRAYPTEVSINLTGGGSVGQLWHTNIGGGVQGKLVRGPEGVYVPSMGGALVCLDGQTGKENWRAKANGAVFSTPLVADGTVYFGSADHFVYAVDAKTGKEKWKRETQGAVFGGAAKAGNVVCIASTDRTIYGLDAQNGSVLWQTAGEGMFQSQAATDGTRFFVGGWDNQFRCLNAQTGKEEWKQTFGRNPKTGAVSFYYAPAIGSPTVDNGRVYVTSNDGILHALDTATGNVLWEVRSIAYGNTKEPRSPALGYSGPLASGDRVYNASLTDAGFVFSFDRDTGNVLWQTPTGSVIYDSSCALGGDSIFVGSVDGTFSCLRARDGYILWQYRLAPGHLFASPATDNERVYIGSLNGEVVAFPVSAPGSASSALKRQP